MPRKPKRLHSSTRWKTLRLAILERDEWRCYVEGCERRASTADHVIPASEAPHLFFDPANLRASCPKHNYGRVTPRMAAMARINRSPGTVRGW
jgi:5-methylcytosine-specific restriction endonuclease McrA